MKISTTTTITTTITTTTREFSREPMPVTRRGVLVLFGASILAGAAGGRHVFAASAAEGSSLRIAAASDLKFAMDEVVVAFAKARPDITVRATYGSSGNIFSQLSNHAPFDLFFSADVRYPEQLEAQGLVLEGSRFSYALGHLVLWVPNGSRIDVGQLGVKALLEPSVRKIAIANPEHAPYGRAAEAALRSLGVYDAVKAKLVLGENISQAAQFVQSGAADAGVLALSIALSPAMRSAGRYWEVPESAYPKLEQAAVTMKDTKSLEAAKALRAFFTGPEGRSILQRYGFRLPGG
jgi:molybdate transport system substrate-binding protein